MNDVESKQTTSYKLLAALSYISYFFLPVIFPLIVWSVCADRPFVKRHAKRAFWSQLIPVICGLVFLIIIGIGGSFNFETISWGWMTVTLVAIICLISLGSLIYNVANAIRVLID